jgi:hypothetical protein
MLQCRANPGGNYAGAGSLKSAACAGQSGMTGARKHFPLQSVIEPPLQLPLPLIRSERDLRPHRDRVEFGAGIC